MNDLAVQPGHVQPGAECYCGDCLAVLPHLPPGSVDAVVCDPPYPCIDRSYGRLTEAEWHGMMHALVPEVRRVLRPSGSAVFVLQPNSERVGRMRPWLWDFLSWLCREWNVVQDAYWWNSNALPGGGEGNRRGLLRASVKACVWAGPPDCYRDQGGVLWGESDTSRAYRASARVLNPGKRRRSGRLDNEVRMYAAVARRGGVTPYNLLPFPGGGHSNRAAHPACTPLALCSWWVRYVSPVGGLVLDPFQGSGTTGLAALSLGRRYVGIEKESDYHAIAVRRLAEAAGPLFAHPAGTVDFDSPPPESQPTIFPL